MTAWVVVLVVITASTLFGDYSLKMATTRPNGLFSGWFWAGALFYGLPAFGWYMLMKTHSLAMIAVLYSSATLILVAALGVVVFKEPMGARQAAGVALAMASVALMWSK